jgi:NAD(P)-dependent dehydrogenase (short-subunit alcohol dehydrogenase family)
MAEMARVLIVTGGSRGIGAAVAVEAARRGYAVAVNYRGNRDRAAAVVADIAKAGGKAVAIAGDVAHEADVERLFAETDGTLGRVTALVNNAGVLGPLGRIDSVPATPLADLVAVNVVGTMLCAREAVKRMSTRYGGGGGAIVNVSSALTRLGGGGETVPYAATKGAIEIFTFGLAQEVATEGIRVNAVSPGVVDTEIHPTGRLMRLGPALPMKRPGRPDEVANAILWLLSPEASYVSGTILGVSGAR